MKFRLGERAIFIPDEREVTIIGPLTLHRDNEGRSWFGYETDGKCSDGAILCPQPHNLRKLDDDTGPKAADETKLGSWDKVGWNPHKIKTTEGA